MLDLFLLEAFSFSVLRATALVCGCVSKLNVGKTVYALTRVLRINSSSKVLCSLSLDTWKERTGYSRQNEERLQCVYRISMTSLLRFTLRDLPIDRYFKWKTAKGRCSLPTKSQPKQPDVFSLGSNGSSLVTDLSLDSDGRCLASLDVV